MILSNAHTHCTVCDGKNTMEEMAQAAAALGFRALGFSSHAYGKEYPVGVGETNVQRYLQDIADLRSRYAGRMAVYAGVELDTQAASIAAQWDYTIGSVHHVCGQDGVLYAVDASPDVLRKAIAAGFGGDALALAEAYFAALDGFLTQTKPTICGHFDLLRCHNGDNVYCDTAHPRYRKAACAVLEHHAGDVIFEINTGGMARGYTVSPYPELWVLQRLHALGGQVMINSDAHSTAHLNAGFETATVLARAAGFTHVQALGMRQMWETVSICG